MAWKVFDEKTAEYDNWFEKSFGAGAFALELKSIKRLVGETLEDSLEIGVGTGRFASSLGVKFGMDPSFHALSYARKRGILVAQATAELLPFRASTFSQIFMIVTVCFLDDPLKAFTEIHRILKPDGKLILGLILADSEWGKFYEHKKASGNPFYQSAYFWKNDELMHILNETGFKVIDAMSTLFDPPGMHIILNKEIKQGMDIQAGFHTLLAKRI
ncbi:MAG: class I SAM-dependent methyltransferase [bacterium]